MDMDMDMDTGAHDAAQAAKSQSPLDWLQSKLPAASSAPHATLHCWRSHSAAQEFIHTFDRDTLKRIR